MHQPFEGCEASVAIPPRLWIYANYDCNLSCTYCVASSHPRAERRSIPAATFAKIVDEAAEIGVRQLFMTGGEPFLLPDIHWRIEHALTRMDVTVLTNGILLLGGRQLDGLLPLRGERLTIQISLDSHSPVIHDGYRGTGSWVKAVSSIRKLRELGFRVSVGATETPANGAEIEPLRTFVRSLGIAEDDFFVRPLVKRGFSQEGLVLEAADLIPEITVNNDGVYWHPLATEADLLLTRRIFPLRPALETLHERYHTVLATGKLPKPFR